MSKQLTVLAVLSMVVMTGCSDSNKINPSSKVISTSQAHQLESEGKSVEAAEMYSRMSEILLARPQGIIHAQKMLDKSLELDSSNNKANIYSAMITPVLKAKGFATRFKEVAKNSPSLSTRFKKIEESAYNSQVEEFVSIATQMPEGVKASKTYDDVRKFLRNEYASELKKSLNKLEKVKGDTILSIDRLAYKNNNSNVSSTNLNSDSQVDLLIQSEIRKEKAEKKIRVDSYDLKALKILLKTQRNALLISTSAELQGLEGLQSKANKGLLKTDEQAVAAIKENSSFLRIDGNKDDLREIFDNSEEVMNDLIDFSKISSELCSNPERKDNAVSEICVTETTAEKIQEILTFVIGPKSIVLGLDENSNEVRVEVDLRALINSQALSLQELLPSKFDENGKALNVKDETFYGVIPNGDLIEKMKLVVK